VDVAREVIQLIKGKGKALQKQRWPHLARWDGSAHWKNKGEGIQKAWQPNLARWARWDEEAGSRELALFQGVLNNCYPVGGERFG
jgi:hypothetical protein